MYAPKSEGGDFEKHPTGWVTGVCTRIIDKGTHWSDRKQKFERKLLIAFESSKLMQEGEFKGEPFLLYQNFNYSMYKNSHLCKFVEAWLGRNFPSQDEADKFNLETLIGRKAFINVVHSDDGKFVNIQTIGPVPEGMTAPDIKGKTILINQADLNMAEVEKLTDKMKQVVLNARERQDDPKYQAMPGQAATTQTSPTGSDLEKSLKEAGMLDEGDRNPPMDDFNDSIPF